MANFSKTWIVYILQSESGKLYTGITTDLERRLSEHQTQKGARFFHLDPADKIVYTETHPNRSEASKRECAIKKLSRSEKIKLIDDFRRNGFVVAHICLEAV